MGLFKVFSSFRFKITVLVTAMVLTAAIGVSSTSLLIAETEMREVIAKQEMSLLTSAAAYIETDLKSKQQLLKVLAEEARSHRIKLSGYQTLF